MEISDILSEDMILADLEVQDKRRLLEQMSFFTADKCSLDENDVFEAVWERENLGSTGYGDGVAFPHARLDSISMVYVCLARLHAPVDYDSSDGKPVDIAVMVISPENGGNDHLQAMSALSQVLKDEKVRRAVRRAKTAHEIYAALQK